MAIIRAHPGRKQEPSQGRTEQRGSHGLPGGPCLLAPAGRSVRLSCSVLSVRGPRFHSLRLLGPAFHLLCPATRPMKREPRGSCGEIRGPRRMCETYGPLPKSIGQNSAM